MPSMSSFVLRKKIDLHLNIPSGNFFIHYKCSC
jgi:hypothetical protein